MPVTSAVDAASDAAPGAVPDAATDADGEADRLTAALAARVDWRYPHAAASGLFAKVAATEVERLGRAFGGEDEAWPLLTPVRRPPLALRLPAGDAVGGVRNAAAGRDLTAAQRGAAVHRALQHLDLGSPLDEGDVRRQLEELVRREVLAPEEAAAVDAAQLARFFRSPLGRLVRKRRDAVRREVAFTCRLPARAVYGGTAVDDGEWVLVQGMIDCVVPVPGGVLVLDFKTDAVRRDDAETAATRYAVQMSIYAHAATRLYGCERAGAFVHFLAPCVTVPVRVRPLFA
ncbi:MAG: PD-(D/E)XK nuclease family protein [Clostridia bacterium]|nr:PD-(D/E)XK nuclease family protein [Clostridia bacterium]